MVLHNKIINKTRSTKNQENSAHTVLGTIIAQITSQNFCKIGLNLAELELFKYALVITFLKESR